jgi:hypothetical protein
LRSGRIIADCSALSSFRCLGSHALASEECVVLHARASPSKPNGEPTPEHKRGHPTPALNREAHVPDNPIAEATYFARAVDDPKNYPPLNSEMKEAIEERQAYERAETAMRGGRTADRDVSKQEKQELMEERIEAYLDRHKEIAI